jgi:hypothetical protein
VARTGSLSVLRVKYTSAGNLPTGSDRKGLLTDCRSHGARTPNCKRFVINATNSQVAQPCRARFKKKVWYEHQGASRRRWSCSRESRGRSMFLATTAVNIRSKLSWITLPDSVPAFEVYYDMKALWPAASLERQVLEADSETWIQLIQVSRQHRSPWTCPSQNTKARKRGPPRDRGGRSSVELRRRQKAVSPRVGDPADPVGAPVRPVSSGPHLDLDPLPHQVPP